LITEDPSQALFVNAHANTLTITAPERLFRNFSKICDKSRPHFR